MGSRISCPFRIEITCPSIAIENSFTFPCFMWLFSKLLMSMLIGVGSKISVSIMLSEDLRGFPFLILNFLLLPSFVEMASGAVGFLFWRVGAAELNKSVGIGHLFTASNFAYNIHKSCFSMCIPTRTHPLICFPQWLHSTSPPSADFFQWFHSVLSSQRQRIVLNS